MTKSDMRRSFANQKALRIFFLIFCFTRVSAGSSVNAIPSRYQSQITSFVDEYLPLFQRQDEPAQAETDLDGLFSAKQDVEGPSFLSGPNDTEVLVSLINSEAEAQISYAFIPASNHTIDDYNIIPVIGDQDILTADDVNIISTETTNLGYLVYNITVDIDFNSWTGTSNFGLQIQNESTSEVVTASTNVELMVVGISFFTEARGEAKLVGGPNYPLTISSQDIATTSDVNLGVFIQYYDGSSSNETLSIPLEGISISTSGLDGELYYNESCSSTGGFFDGSDVILPPNCGIGFSTNSPDGSYQRPNIGFDFLPYQNGSFTVSFEWNELVEGSDLELDGFSTYIDVNIEGDIPPAVIFITPPGPFQTLGTDTVVLYVENLPDSVSESAMWTYELSIEFEAGSLSASFESGSIVEYENGTKSLSFTLPAGSGTNIPWTLSVTDPGSGTFTAVDQTKPTFLFTFSSAFIESIIPDSGPEQGGTAVSLIGSFSGIENETPIVFFDGTPIDSALITLTEARNITFITPSKASIGTGFDVNVTVVVGDETSNAVTFSYKPNVILESLAPPYGPAEGGTNVSLTGEFNNFDPSLENSGVFFGDVQIDPSLILSSNSTVIVFTTPPQSSFGNEEAYSYNVTVQVQNSASNSIQFTYEFIIEITSITPASGAEEGGTEVTLSGNFFDFNPDSSGVYIGGKKIDSPDVTYDGSVIVFSTPSRPDVGTAYKYDVWVTIGSQNSNHVQFTYEDRGSGAIIDPGGGSFDSTAGEYQLGACVDSLYRASISRGARTQNPSYKWTLTAVESQIDVLTDKGIVSNADVLLIPYIALEQDVAYNLTLIVATDFSTFESSLTLKQLSEQKIGVRISNPRPRSFSDPNITLTIPAELFVPGCQTEVIISNSSAMTYEWFFRNETFLFSHENKTAPEEQVSPTLLGREIHIPQGFMEYGSFPLSLTAYFTEQRSIQGKGTTIVIIEPAPLIAQINGGETSQVISATEEFALSASQSRDPDVLQGEPASGLEYKWSCRYGWSESMRNAVPCGESLLSSDDVNKVSFVVTAQSLSSVQNSSSLVYIEFGLQVNKTSLDADNSQLFRVSDIVRSTLVLPQEQEQRFESLKEVVVINNQSLAVDKANVKYYEDIIITPISETEETTWSFKLLLPASQSRTLLATDDNLLILPGYVSANSEASRLSLGLKANVLSPNTEYRFLISTFRTGYSVNEQVISLTTVDKPEIILGNLATPSGTTEDTFVLSAYSDYDGDFKFFFMLTDDFAFETCVGGCQGENVVQFRLATAGNYIVRCNVYDSLGYTLLANSTGGSITVSSVSSGTDLSRLAVDAEVAFLAGDHATYQQLGSDMVKYIWSIGESQSPDLDSVLLANFTEGMNQVAANAVPNAIQSAGYVRIAASLASLTPTLGITYDTQTLYFLVNITVSAIERVPDNGALQILEQLLDFYDLTPDLVLATYSEGTSRRRLLQETQDTKDNVFGIWLDLYEVMKEQILITVLKRCTCGCAEEITTGGGSPSRMSLNSRRLMLSNGRNLSAAASYINSNQGRLTPVTMKLAHFCNSEQGTDLKINEGTEDEVQFSWCKGVFQNSIKKLYFALVKTPDYVFLSQLHRNVTLSDGLVGTVIAKLKGNMVQNAALPINECYMVRVPLLRNFTDEMGALPRDEEPRGLLLAPSKEWAEPVSSGLYAPIFSDVSTSFSDSAMTADTEYTTASLTLSTTGVLAIATSAAWGSALFSLEGFFLLAAEIAGVTLSIFVLVLMASVSAWLIATRLFATPGPLPPVEADFTYVERDVYGRGTALDMMEEHDELAERRGAIEDL